MQGFANNVAQNNNVLYDQKTTFTACDVWIIENPKENSSVGIQA